MVNPDTDGYIKPQITGKYPQKTQKNNNLLKPKRILKLKCELSGARFFHFACQEDDSPHCPPPITPLALRCSLHVALPWHSHCTISVGFGFCRRVFYDRLLSRDWF